MKSTVENKETLEKVTRQLEQRDAELALINSVQEGLAKELDLNGIYNLVGNRIRELFNAQSMIIATFDYEKEREIFNYGWEKGEFFIHEPRPINKLRRHLIETKDLILINKNADEAIQ